MLSAGGKKMFKGGICLKYPRTSIKIKDQITERLRPIFEFLSCNRSLGIKFSTSVVDGLGRSADYSIYSLDQKYWVDYIRGLLLEKEDKDFWVLFEICIRVIHFSELRNYIHFDYNYDKLIDDLNTIMEKNDVNLKIEDGCFINISKTYNQKKCLKSPTFTELEREGFTNVIRIV